MIVRVAAIAAAAMVLPLMSAATQAAMLQEIQGVVLVDRGGGFDITDGPTQLNPGDSVIANPGGGAEVIYPDGCTVPVRPGAIVAAHKKSPCSKEATNQEGAEGGEGGGALDATTLLVGGAAVGLGVGAAILLIADDPASP